MEYISLICVLTICIALLHWKYLTMERKRYPTVYKKCWPFLGHAHLLVGDTIELWKVIKNITKDIIKSGGINRVFIGHSTYYFITDPEMVVKVGNACDNKHFIYGFGKSMFGDGLATGSGEAWRRHRKLLAPAFNHNLMLGFLDLFNRQCKKFIATLDSKVKEGSPIDIFELLKKMSLQNILMSSFRMSSNTADKLYETYAECFDEIFNICTLRAQNVWFHYDYIYKWSNLKRKEDKILKKFFGMSNKNLKTKLEEYMNNTRQDLTSVGAQKSVFMDRLWELSQLEGVNKFTDKDMQDEVNTIISAALDTSALLLTYIFLLLGVHTDVQDKVYNEIINVMGDLDKEVESADLTKLVYIDAVIKETLRFISPLPLTLRTLLKDIQLDNYTLKAGHHCILSFVGMHLSPCWGKDVESFRPERWLEADVPEHAFAGFSFGRRSCPGQSYGTISVKTTLVHLCRRYKFSASMDDLVVKLDFMLKVESGHLVNMQFR